MGRVAPAKHFSLLLFLLLFALGFFRYLPIYFDNPEWHPDITLNGNFAYHFISGRVILPFFAYSHPPYAHGPQVMSILLIPFYYLDGPYFGWLLILGVLISSLIFAFSVSLLKWDSDKNRIWAIAFVLLVFLLPPPIYKYFMRAIWGSHFETTLFFVVSLTIFCWAQRKESSKYPFFIFGLFLGFSCYFCYTSFSFALALTCSMWYLKRKRFLKHLWVFAVGFLVGFLPAILYNLTYDRVIFGRHLSRSAIAASYPEARIGRNVGFFAIYDLIFKVMPRFLSCTIGYCKPNASSITFALLFGTSFVHLFWRVFFKREKNPLQVGIFSSVVVFVLFYAISPYAVFDYNNGFYYRYLIFLFPAIVISVSLLLKNLKILAPIVAISLAFTYFQDSSHLIKRDFEFIFKSKKGYDIARILYTESMTNYLNKDKTKTPELATKIAHKISGFEKVVALKEVGNYRLSLFDSNEGWIDDKVLRTVSAHDRKWLAFGWGSAQANCFAREICEMPIPELSSDEEQKWFSVGFILGHFWNRNDSNFKTEELALISRINPDYLAFALGFSAGDSIYPLPPNFSKSKDQYDVIRGYLVSLGGIDNASVHTNFWNGVGCEIAFWFLTENFMMREEDFKKLLTPPDMLKDFVPDFQSLKAGWDECLKEFGCKQTEEEWEIGRVIKVLCKGEEF